MLTNLAYAGGGTNTYGDTKSITSGTITDYTRAHYTIPASGAGVTSGTTNPSTSTTGKGQYGYQYNWCAAMGAQTSTAACANATTPAPDPSVSICPSGWRLPTGGTSGEFMALNTAINSGSTSSDTGLRTTWLGMYAGYWYNGGPNYNGERGMYWSSSSSSDPTVGRYLRFYSTDVTASTQLKTYRLSVRCIAN